MPTSTAQPLPASSSARTATAYQRAVFLQLDQLVQAAFPVPVGEHAAGELVDDLHDAVLHDVVTVALKQVTRAQRLLVDPERTGLVLERLRRLCRAVGPPVTTR